ncbi:MAG: hypothetical protein KC586_11570, partial [Myxococcales bacterium]|nr:hypothetical protein [Myxococcales bacterium]
IRMLAPEVLDVATLPLDEATEHVVDGLAGDTDYTFELVSVNGAGELSPFPSAPITVRTLPAPELYVAPYGDDAHPRAGTRLNPFATVTAALRSSDTSLPITLRLAAGTYRESTLRIADRTVTIEGGYDASWTRGGGPSVLSVASSGDLEPLTATRFNTTRRRTRAAIQTERATLTLDAVELVVSDASATSCVTALWAHASDVRLRNSIVTGARSGPCRVAIAAHEGQLSLLDSTLSATSTVPSTASEHVALFTRATAEVTVADSELFGVDARASGPFTSSVRGAFGWIDQGTSQLRMTRSQASAATGFAASPLSADVVGALDLTGVGSFFVDNSVLQTPRGARAADVVRVAGAESVRIYQSTVVLGHEFAPATRNTSDRSSVIRLEGRVRSFALYNDLLAYADWSAATPYAAVLDLAGLDRVALLASSVRGNVFSYPPADRVTAGLGGGPLVMCDFLGEEFSVVALSETQLNQTSHYTCRSGGTVVASNNVALLTNPGTSPASRSGVVLEESGDVVHAGSPSTHPTVTDVLRAGAILPTSFPWAEVSRDRVGVMRSGPARPGVGAFVIP